MPSSQKIKSISDLVKILKSDLDPNCIHWFRGHEKQAWKLVPSFYRLTSGESEVTLITRFKQNAAFLLEEHPKDSFDWLFLMQHYGVPTRLLDWTESALAALYFASCASPKVDGALWVLDPVQLNANANIESAEKNFIPSFEGEELSNYDPVKLAGEQNTTMKPIAAIATRNSSRIQAQLGVFTINHREKTPLEVIGNKKHIKKYIIPAKNKSGILTELKLCGISKFQLFPELSSIGDNIKSGLKWRK